MSHYAVWDDTGKIVYRIAGEFKQESFTPYTKKGLSWGEFPDGTDGASHIVNGIPVSLPPPVESVLAEIRSERNRRLAACDWTQVADAPTNKDTWAAYRQQLRDFPAVCDPYNPIWPTPPA